MEGTTLAIIAILAALGLIGVIAVEILTISQQVQAARPLNFGCSPDGQGFTSSNGQCSHIIITNGSNGRSFHP